MSAGSGYLALRMLARDCEGTTPEMPAKKVTQQTPATTVDPSTSASDAIVAKLDLTVDTATAAEGQDELSRMQAQRAALDAQIKAKQQQDRASRAAAKVASVKTLDQVIAEQDAEHVQPWMASTLVARVAQRVRAHQSFEAATDDVFAAFRTFMETELANRAAAAEARKATKK